MQRDFLWEDKYAPTDLSQYVFQSERIKSEITDIINAAVLPSLLISGIQGTGKTTLARVLLHEFHVERIDTLIINASRERGIDTIRESVADFCKTFPLGDIKVVLLEEADGLTPDAQASLRSTMDEYKKTVRFILTCNYENKIIAPLKSRLREIKMDAFSRDELLMRAADILEQEHITVTDIATLERYVDYYQPDLRKIIVAIQQASTTGELKPLGDGGAVGAESIERWQRCWETGEISLDSLLEMIRGGAIDSSNYERYYRLMYDNLHTVKSLTAEAPVVIAEHLYRAAFVADQEINMAACLIRMLTS